MSGLRIDELGPYSMPQLREIASLLPPKYGLAREPLVTRVGDDFDYGKVTSALSARRPVILLWCETPAFGHFIMLHRRRDGVELYDPLGTTDGEDMWEHYMDDPTGLNGGGLRPYLQSLHEDGVELSYNPPSAGSQPESADSCGLWCLFRAMAPEQSPTEFHRGSRRRRAANK